MNGYFPRLRRTGNEQGFILPLTLVIVFLISAFLLHEVKMYETEKQFMYTREDMFTLNQLMEMAHVDLQARLRNAKYKDGIFRFPKGTVHFSVKKSGKDMLRITLQAETKNGGVHVSRVYYNKTKQKIVRWEEGL